MKKISVILIALMFLCIRAASAESSIKAEVDKTKISTDDTLTYKLTLASSDKNLPAPKTPEFKGFQVASSAQSSSVSFVKSEIKTFLVLVFILYPTEAGKFTIEPSTIKIKNKTYSTDTFDIEVTQGKSRPEPGPEKKPSFPEEIQPETEEPQFTI